MSLRIRQVKPDFWRDSVVAKLDDTTRLVYVGLWMEADDAGWLALDITQIAADLWPYLSIGPRERKLERSVESLVAAKRVEIHDCGHALIPRLTAHQHLAAPEKRVHTVLRKHQRDCLGEPTRGDPRTPAEARNGDPHLYGGEKEGNGTVRNGGVRGGAPVGADLFEIKDGRLAKKAAAAAGDL